VACLSAQLCLSQLRSTEVKRRERGGHSLFAWLLGGMSSNAAAHIDCNVLGHDVICVCFQSGQTPSLASELSQEHKAGAHEAKPGERKREGRER
jgi:hypothetical protein